jgi:hypothetical protein
MNTIETVYEQTKRQFGAEHWPEFEIPGGKVALSPQSRHAVVFTDGRYPALADGFHLNALITESEQIVWGGAVVEFEQPHELVVVKAGDVIGMPPGRPYSLSGKCVSFITMDRPWDSGQKRFVGGAAGDTDTGASS